VEYWQAWLILIALVVGGLAAGIGITYYYFSQPAVPEVQEPAIVEKPQVQPPQDQPKPTQQVQQPTEPRTQAELSEAQKQVKKIIDTYDASVNGFLYFYEGNKYYVKKNKIKIEYNDMQGLSSNVPYNTVYLDTITREAVAFCQDLDDASGRRCAGREKTPVPMQFNQFYTLTPNDWIQKLRTATTPTVKLKAKMLFNRNVHEVTWDNIILYVDSTFGVPMQAIEGSNQYSYMQMAVNQVTAKDVTRPDQG